MLYLSRTDVRRGEHKRDVNQFGKETKNLAPLCYPVLSEALWVYAIY